MFVIEWQDIEGTWQLPGCTIEEATYATREEAQATIDAMQREPEWSDVEWRIREN